jgi:predicted RNA methylase
MKSANHKAEKHDETSDGGGWLLQCPPGLAGVLKKEMVFAGVIHRDQQIFIKRQRNHDLVFLNRVKSPDGMARLRIAETILRCPVYGRFKISKRQLGLMAEELKSLGDRRLVVTVAGRNFQRHDLSRFLDRELEERGYTFNDQVEDETWMFCIDESWYFGLPLKKARTAEGRDERKEERRGSLPPPIAAALAFAGMPKPDDIVMDPVCGSGTVLAECHAYAKEARLIGMDIDSDAVAIARKNLAKIEGIEINKGDSTRTGMSGANVSLVLANLPFGLQFGKKTSNPKLYRELLQEQLRLRDQGKNWRAIVFTSDIESLQDALKEIPELQSESLFKVKARGELAFAYRLKLRG